MMSDEVELEEVTKPRRGRPPIASPATGAEQPVPFPPPPAEPAVSPEDGYELYASVPPAKMRVMELKRHYRPVGPYEVVGYWQPEIKRKGTDGKETIIQAKEFVANQPAPSPMPGVANANKVWAGTVIRLGVDEAKTMRANDIADVSLEDD